MRSTLLVAVGVMGVALAPTSAQAFGHRGDCGAPACTTSCAPPPQIQWVEKTVTCYRPVMRERQVAVTVNRVVPREVIVPVTRTVMVPETRHVQKTIAV